MKYLILLVLMSNLTIAEMGQNISASFEPGDESLKFVHLFGGSVIEIIENPLKEGINTSDFVAKTYKDGYQVLDWAGMSTDLHNYYVEIQESTKIRIQVYAESNPGLFKLKFENYFLGPNGKVVEFDSKIDKVGEWIEIEFDISHLQSEYYNRIVLFFDIGQTDGDVFYFDNLRVTN